jgi:hypothetical protein
VCFGKYLLETVNGMKLQYDSKSGSKYYEFEMYRVTIIGDGDVNKQAFRIH